MRARVSSDTGLSLLSARETVIRDTPAARATSSMVICVTGLFSDFLRDTGYQVRSDTLHYYIFIARRRRVASQGFGQWVVVCAFPFTNDLLIAMHSLSA